MFVLRNPSLQSTWLLQRSVTVCCPFCCFCVTPFFNSAAFCLSTSISSSISTWCSLPFSATFHRFSFFLFTFLFHFLFLLLWNDAYKIMVGCRSCTYSSIHLFMAFNLKIMVGCRSCTDPSILVKKNLYTRVGLLGPYCRKWWRELWARPTVLAPVPSQANNSSSTCRRFQTGQTPEKNARLSDSLVNPQTPEKIARMFRLLGPSLETLLRRWHTHVGLLGPCFNLGENRRKLHTCKTPGSVPREISEKLAFMSDSLVRVAQQQR